MRNLILNLLLLFIVLICFEAVSFFAGSYLKKKGVYYNQPSIDTYSQYLEDRHSVLGWPSKSHLNKLYDTEGSRPVPSYPDPRKPSCVSLYGDSFTWGDHVSDKESISNIIAEKLGCRVSNFGVSGYGTDQMLLRFLENSDDEASIVVLNHFSGDIRRNVTQLRNLMAESDSQYILLKPRYVLDGDQILLRPLPTLSDEEVTCWAQTPHRCVPQEEYYTPGGDSGINYFSFPYTVSLLKAFGNEHIQAKIMRKPVWSLFYEDDHPSQALEITARIMEKFVEEAKRRNKTPIVSILANVHDVEYYRESGVWGYQNLIDRMKKSGIDVVNVGESINEAIGERDPCEFGNESCYGHLTAEGNEVVASRLLQAIENAM